MNRVIACLIAVLLAACGNTSVEARAVAFNSKEMNTVCMGRHQMDLPKEFEQSMGSTSIFTPAALPDGGAPIDVSVKSARIEPGEYKLEVDKRHAAIQKAQRERTNILKEVITVSKEATIFRVNNINEAYRSELHVWKGGTYFVAASDSYRNTYKQAEERLLALAANVEVSARPAQAGFCLGPIVVKGNYAGEYGKLTFRNKATPDMAVTVSIDTYLPDSSKTLLVRTSGSNSLLNHFSAKHKVLRKGELQVAGMRTQEWLSWVMLGKNGDHKEYGFALETLRPAPGPMQPRIFLEFKTGEQGGIPTLPDSSLSDDEAIAMWDAIIGSIRQRAGRAAP